MRLGCFCLLALLAATASAAERRFDFGTVGENQLPPGFRSVVTGAGKPGEWKVLLEETAPLLAPVTPGAPSNSKRAVLAQVSKDPTDDHYPLLIYDDEVFADFKLTTQFKVVEGTAEQMAGIAFRIQDEHNYYYVRASALGSTFKFSLFVKGELPAPVGSNIEITRGVWHEMAIECKGSFITCWLDGKVAFPQLRRDDFPKGKIGFWTKSDSVSYFADTRIVYTPQEVPGQALVQRTLKKYSHLMGLQIYIAGSQTNAPQLIASKDSHEVGQHGGDAEADVITNGKIYCGKEKGVYSVTMPLQDRNGDTIAAARVVMKAFVGQTEANAIARARTIVQELQRGVHSLQDLIP